MKINKRQLIQLANTLNSLSKTQGKTIQFALGIARNLVMIDEDIKVLATVEQNIRSILANYKADRKVLLQKYAIALEDGSMRFKDEESSKSFREEEQKMCDEKGYTDDINKFNEQMQEFNKMLDTEDVEFDFYKIKEDCLSENLTGEQLYILLNGGILE